MDGSQKYSQQIKESLRKQKQLSSEEKVVEAYRAIGEIKQVDADKVLSQIWSRIDRPLTTHILYKHFTQIAAILILPLFLVALWGITRQQPVTRTEFVSQEITAPPGIRSFITLPDSTHVWLNAGSSIRYQIPFVDGQREVRISGEAFFEVTHDAANPFVVHAGASDLKVLGTTFNIKAYAGDSRIEVALLEGKVQFSVFEEPDKASGIILNQGERAVFEKDKGIVVRREPLEKYAAWRYGKLVFEEASMQEVADRLERWFGVKVIVNDPSLKSYHFTTTFDNQSLTQILELLELSSPISVNYEPAKLNSVTNTGEPGKVYFDSVTKNNGK